MIIHLALVPITIVDLDDKAATSKYPNTHTHTHIQTHIAPIPTHTVAYTYVCM